MAKFEIKVTVATRDEDTDATATTTHNETHVSPRSMIELQEALLGVMNARKDAQKAKLPKE
jgi:hypothetical protein